MVIFVVSNNLKIEIMTKNETIQVLTRENELLANENSALRRALNGANQTKEIKEDILSKTLIHPEQETMDLFWEQSVPSTATKSIAWIQKKSGVTDLEFLIREKSKANKLYHNDLIIRKAKQAAEDKIKNTLYKVYLSKQ